MYTHMHAIGYMTWYKINHTFLVVNKYEILKISQYCEYHNEIVTVERSLACSTRASCKTCSLSVAPTVCVLCNMMISCGL